MEPIIYLALTHDWELRGDGSGDIERIQFAPLRSLLEIYDRFGVHTTILPDVMQQLRFRNLEHEHQELAAMAGLWDEHLREAFGRGHDIQLHLHPQWRDGVYKDGHWNLTSDWSIIKYDPQAIRVMLSESIAYLEHLLQPLDSAYRCLAFRAGALAAAPSDHLFPTLADLGIELDVSIAPGLSVSDHHLQLDFRNCEEDFLPYYPVMRDARRVSNRREPIVCLPLTHFYGTRSAVTKHNLSLIKAQVSNRVPSPAANRGPSPNVRKTKASRAKLAFEKLIKPAISKKYFVADTSRLNFSLMKEMLKAIRIKAKNSGRQNVPVVLTNHPKDIRDWKAIERFVAEASQASDLRFFTLTDLVKGIKSGEFCVLTGS